VLNHHPNDEFSLEKTMDHGEAIQMMTAERYLLNELTADERDSFEQHLFGCQECALDLRAGAAFMSEAKTQLAKLDTKPAASTTSALPAHSRPQRKNPLWSWILQPAFAVPAFAVMLGVIAYQNFSAIPSLRRAATEPRILYSNPIHLGTRGSVHTTVQANRSDGLALSMELPQSETYSSYAFQLFDPNGKQFWTRTLSRSNPAEDGGFVSLVIPGSGLLPGSYTLAISGVTPQNERVEIDRRVLDVQFDK
jgi:hypothetical protein